MILSSCYFSWISTPTLLFCASLSMSVIISLVSSLRSLSHLIILSGLLSPFTKHLLLIFSAGSHNQQSLLSILSETTLLLRQEKATLLSAPLCLVSGGRIEERCLHYFSGYFSILTRPRCLKKPPSCVLAITPVRGSSSSLSCPPPEWAVQMMPLLTSHWRLS